jgi:hypothetical protein
VIGSSMTSVGKAATARDAINTARPVGRSRGHATQLLPRAPNVVWFCTCAPQTSTDRQEQAFVSRRRAHAEYQSRTHQGSKATGTDALHKQGGKGLLGWFSGLLQIAMHTLYIVPYINSKCAKAGKWQHTHTYLILVDSNLRIVRRWRGTNHHIESHKHLHGQYANNSCHWARTVLKRTQSPGIFRPTSRLLRLPACCCSRSPPPPHTSQAAQPQQASGPREECCTG